MQQERNRCAGRCALRGALALLGAMCLACLGSAAGSDRVMPSFTYHYAVTGAYEHLINTSGAPIEHDVIVFYEHTLGKFPRIDIGTGARVHGGVPHLADYSAHISACMDDIIEQIPDPDWDGYAVIDYESWTPWWNDTQEPYRVLTREIVRRNHPSFTPEQVEAFSIVTYESNARRIFEGTIELGRALRPNAKWGFWAYPKGRLRDNYDTQWMWDASDAFYPSVYMRYYLVPDDVTPRAGEERYSRYMDRVFYGNLGYARDLAGGEKPVLAFAWPRYDGRNENQWYRRRELEPEHLRLMLLGPYAWDADGVVLWDNLPQPGLAEAFQTYFDESIAPEMRFMHQLVLEQDQLDDALWHPADVNRDGAVDTLDLITVINRFGTSDPRADINDDGIVDTIDLSFVQQAIANS